MREAERRPAPSRRDRRERLRRVGRTRVPDDLEQRQVLLAVGVEVAPGQVGAAALRERLSVDQLSFAGARRRHDLARQGAVEHLEARAEDVADAELACDRVDLIRRRRRDDGERVSLAAVRVHQGARLGMDARRERVAKQLLAELHHLGLVQAGERACARGDEAREADRAELVARRGHREIAPGLGTEAPRANPVAHERDRREAGDQGAVEVEKGRRLGPALAGIDLPGQIGIRGHGVLSPAPDCAHRCLPRREDPGDASPRGRLARRGRSHIAGRAGRSSPASRGVPAVGSGQRQARCC